jgi:hypothetical protein
MKVQETPTASPLDNIEQAFHVARPPPISSSEEKYSSRLKKERIYAK